MILFTVFKKRIFPVEEIKISLVYSLLGKPIQAIC